MSGIDQSNHLWAKFDSGLATTFGEAIESVALETGATLVATGQSTEHVHFVEAGLLSVLSDGAGDGVEVGMIGRDGLSGSWLALGRRLSPFRVVVQAGGTASRMSAAAFRRACAASPDLQEAVLCYAGDFTAMVAETCRATARLTLEGRLARWLLMAHDRLDGDEITITHETLARTLGVRRPGVTVVLHVLEGERMIRATRGTIRVLDRGKLAAVARGFYREAAAARPPPGERCASLA